MRKRRIRKRRVLHRRPNRQKTFWEISQLQGTEYYLNDEGIVFYLMDEVEDRMVSIGDLLTKFYTLNEEQQPLVFRLIDDKDAPLRGEKLWQIVFRGSFIVEIESGHEKQGPHRCRLYFKSFSQNKAHWIATLQLMAFFYNEEQMKNALLESVSKQEFFMLPQNKERPITL
jgi:hypothetical protein